MPGWALSDARRFRNWLVAIGGGALVASTVLAQPAGYTLYIIPPLAGHNATYALDVNESGLVVGWSQSSSTNTRAISWTVSGGTQALAGTAASLAYGVNVHGDICGRYGQNSARWLNGVLQVQPVDGHAYDINDAGTIVGTTGLGNNAYYRNLDGSVSRILGTLPGYCAGPAVALAVNNAGITVGYATVCPCGILDVPQPVAWIMPTSAPLRCSIDPVNCYSVYGTAYDINDNGVVAMEYERPGAWGAAIANVDGTDVQIFGAPPGSQSVYNVAISINNSNQVLCITQNSSNVVSTYFWDNGTFTNIDLPGTSNVTGLTITDSGMIVGYGRNAATNTDRGWVLIPDLPCIGDLNGDDGVDLTDLSVLLAHFGVESGATAAEGDINGDGAVNLTDLSALLAHFGESCP